MREKSACGSIPALGHAVPRERLLNGFLHEEPSAVFIVAPSGYGKTVLAAQLAATGRFRRTLWIDAQRRSLTGSGLFEALVGELGTDLLARTGADLLLPCETSEQIEERLSRALDDCWGVPTCLIIDDLARVPDSETVSRLRVLLSKAVSADHCVILTSREMNSSGPVPSGGWLLDADDLKLAADEAEPIAQKLQGGNGIRVDAAEILSACSGHPALFAVMVRHQLLRSGSGNASIPSGLLQQLDYLADAHLEPWERQALCAASLLRKGTARDVERVLLAGFDERSLLRLSQCIPLVHLTRDDSGNLCFCVHDLAREHFAEGGGLEGREFRCYVTRSQETLAARCDYWSLLELALSHGEPGDMPELLERFGSLLLERGGAVLLRHAFDAVGAEVLVHRPALLLLQAKLEQYLGNYREAASSARIAADLAGYSSDESTAISATLVLGRALLSVGEAREARGVLEPVTSLPAITAIPDMQLLLFAYLGLASTHLGDRKAAEEFFRRARGVCQAATSGRAKHHLDAAEAYFCCALLGDFSRALALYVKHLRSTDCSADIRLPSLGNSALALCRRGSLPAALELADEVLRSSEDYSARAWRHAWLSSRACILAALGDYTTAESDAAAAIRLAEEVDECDTHIIRTETSVWRRAAGDVDGAFGAVEAAREYLKAAAMLNAAWFAEAELAANFLALGDTTAAARYAEATQRLAGAVGGDSCLAARLVLAEIARRSTRQSDAAEELVLSIDHILSGNGNWITAMYIRAFPGLLGVVAKAVGPNRIPAHLLRMILPENAEKALPLARDILAEDEFTALAERLGVDAESAEVNESPLAPTCRVRLFGGLQVEIAGRRITDAAWRKRKARLLFAMLVVRKGRDVPREQLLEYLWPEMDAERAISNFYVVWNNMKNALCPDLPKGQSLPYARTAGGVCRLDDLLVASDLDEFERALSDIRRAEAAEDAESVGTAAQRLVEVYRGDLLPGDIYDDWFAPLRERCRQEFGDAMQQAARLHEARGEHVAALQMVRAALAHDAWREDLYQAALRCQIASGQRSAAIDTYMTCMHKLSEDLGLDPSVETRKLYERVLAMEVPAEGGYAG